MLLMQIEFHAFPSVLSWFHGASFKPIFAAIEEAFPSHFFRFSHHLTASSPEAWQFSPSWLRFVVFDFLFLIPYSTDLRSGSVIFKTFYLSITVSRATITVFPAVTKTIHSFNKLLSSTLRQTGFNFFNLDFVVYARISWNNQTIKELSLSLLSLSDVFLFMLFAVFLISTFMYELRIILKHHL